MAFWGGVARSSAMESQTAVMVYLVGVEESVFVFPSHCEIIENSLEVCWGWGRSLVALGGINALQTFGYGCQRVTFSKGGDRWRDPFMDLPGPSGTLRPNLSQQLMHWQCVMQKQKTKQTKKLRRRRKKRLWRSERSGTREKEALPPPLLSSSSSCH